MYNIILNPSWVELGRAGDGGIKLSKYLLSQGVPEALAGACKRFDTWVTADPQDIREQADSKFFLSCQASTADPSHNQIAGDLAMAEQGHLFLWVIGQRMSLNGEGFQARAKVRTLTDGIQVRGLYVERVYGTYVDLWNSRDQLEAWATSYFGHPVPIMTLSEGEGVELLCPSAAAGCQDTQAFRIGGVGPHRFEVFSLEREVEKLLAKGHALSDITFNPQNGRLKVKK